MTDNLDNRFVDKNGYEWTRTARSDGGYDWTSDTGRMLCRRRREMEGGRVVERYYARVDGLWIRRAYPSLQVAMASAIAAGEQRGMVS